MKLGYVLSGLEVEEGEVYTPQNLRPSDDYVWLRRDGRIGTRYMAREVYASLDEAVAEAQVRRARHIKSIARQLERHALNPSIKVRLLKPKKSHK